MLESKYIILKFEVNIDVRKQQGVNWKKRLSSNKKGEQKKRHFLSAALETITQVADTLRLSRG